MKIKKGKLALVEYRPSIYVELVDFPKANPKGDGKVIYKTVQARDDDAVLVNLDYDINGKLVGIEILEHLEPSDIGKKKPFFKRR